MRLALMSLAMVVWVACLDNAANQCSNGNLCPADKHCVAGGELCANDEQLAACVGIVDGETCSVTGGVGVCDRGVCIGTGCGNSVVDPREACDDGNATGGDGCSADCRKAEMCGDGVPDAGEGCDDGNANPADGCDTCVPTSWRPTALIGGNSVATSVGLAGPRGVVVDAGGNIYIADTGNHRIRRVDATAGITTTVAGSGTPGFSGDGGAATSAALDSPYGVAVDGFGTLYISDTNNHRIRRVDAAGIITTVAGGGIAGLGDGGAATGAQLSFPRGVAVDGLRNVYVADSSNHRVRRIDATTAVITTVAGTTQGMGGDGGAAISAQLNTPYDVAVDGLGALYIADRANQRIRKVDAGGAISTVAGTTAGFFGDGGAATSARLFSPESVSVALDVIYIADRSNDRIRRVEAGVITTIAGSGVAGSAGDGGAPTSAELDAPSGVAVDGSGAVYIADRNNQRVRRVAPAGTVITTIAGTGIYGFTGDGGAATSAPLYSPGGVAVDSAGNVYLADAFNQLVRRVGAASGVITIIAGTGYSGFSGDGGAAISARLFDPNAVAVDGMDHVYIADTVNHRVRRVDAMTSVITTVAGTGTAGTSSTQLDTPYGIAVDALGTVYIADTNNHRIMRVAAGLVTTVAGTGTAGSAGDGSAATSAQLRFPRGVVVDGMNNLFIADTNNHRVRRVDGTTGVITTVAGTGTAGSTLAQLDTPSGVAVDSAGNVYIADTTNDRIMRIAAMTGSVTTVAGTGSLGSSGDGDAATGAQLNSPRGVAVDGAGNFYIADTGNERIRRVDASGVITTSVGRVDPEGMGPFAQARLADPRALVVAAPFTLVAGGTTGTVQAARNATAWLEVVAGRYPQPAAIGMFARFRNQSFGTVSGIAYDDAAGLIYLTESSSNRLHVVTVVDALDENTWTIAPLANGAGTAGFADGAIATARFSGPTGLYFDAAVRRLYVADTGNHVIRAIELSSGLAAATVHTVAGIPAMTGFFGDGGVATAALLYAPQAITRCANGDLFVADSGNHRVRRVAGANEIISTVLGDGVAASSGEGSPASTFPVNAPLGLACDATGNLFVTSTTSVRLLPANPSSIVDGTGAVQTIYGAPPRDTFPSAVTRCLSGLAIVDAASVHVVDSCTGLLIELRRVPAEPQ